MKYIIFISLIFFFSCKKETEMSDCIEAKVETFKTALRVENESSVSEYCYKNRLYYKFDYGASADWDMYLLDNQCDTICETHGLQLVPSRCKIDNFFKKATKTKVIFE
jgi:hypothetical protein